MAPAVRPAIGALCGLIAAGAGLAAAEVVGAITRPEATPLLVVGAAVIDLVPRPLKEFAVATFGTADKAVLLGGMAVTLAALAALVGSAARRRPAIGDAGIVLAGLISLVAALTRPDGGLLDGLPSLLGAAVAIALLRLLIARAPREAPRQEADDLAPASSPNSAKAAEAPDATPEDTGGFDRRRFVLVAGAAAAVSAGAGACARWYAASKAESVAAARKITLPAPASPAPPFPDGADLELEGLAPFLTPSTAFFRIDTALSVPRIDATTWTLRIHGRGVTERQYSFDDLLNRSDLMERDITLACVSNPVGGSYIGNARWIGVPLATLLKEAGVRPPTEGGPADQLVSRSSDGMTIGTPVADVLDGRDAMLALGMNGRPLLPEHGFPVRMLVPGLYGYVSACKWIVEIELTTFDAFDAYWVPRGWSDRAPIKTQSRIDTPTSGARIDAGRVAVAGAAWAQRVGVDAVEVRVDDGPWRPARLAEEDTTDTWRQWVLEWEAEPGEHRLSVRATDRNGTVQTEDEAPPAPDGATGWHTIDVTVE
ncbi:molybdopterin-binding oxidoreductase [Nocardiopsis gilva YIM 90087]|uniref:Molybdopterin-binding oxidoreductase n=1 Tax=Nocardiopsis gilva YIM 90087 TaxID=1235441 RepID=A0A223S8Q6_9ACTN|nr:molybdopterin-dependent oxidoreductase [Nocardiopsis gilva]ASU84462.1 molybdopterin-binding oxidoreductase [Nocardiopsis gilva YIM 90087]